MALHHNKGFYDQEITSPRDTNFDNIAKKIICNLKIIYIYVSLKKFTLFSSPSTSNTLSRSLR